MKVRGDCHLDFRLAMSLRLSHPLPKLAKNTKTHVTGRAGPGVMAGEDYSELNSPMAWLPGWNAAVLAAGLRFKKGNNIHISRIYT